MKKIIIQNFVQFINLEDKPQGIFVNTYRSGYWNVYNWNEEAIGYLEENCIKYTVTDKSMID